MRKVIVNSTPLIVLCGIGRLVFMSVILLNVWYWSRWVNTIR